MRILLIITFWCVLPATLLAHCHNAEVPVRIAPYNFVRDIIEAQSQIPADAILSSEPMPQVSCSEPIRVQPTHSGKTNRHTDKISKSEITLLNCPPLCNAAARLLISAASPRFYYVLALRRILC